MRRKKKIQVYSHIYINRKCIYAVNKKHVIDKEICIYANGNATCLQTIIYILYIAAHCTKYTILYFYYKLRMKWENIILFFFKYLDFVVFYTLMYIVYRKDYLYIRDISNKHVVFMTHKLIEWFKFYYNEYKILY